MSLQFRAKSKQLSEEFPDETKFTVKGLVGFGVGFGDFEVSFEVVVIEAVEVGVGVDVEVGAEVVDVNAEVVLNSLSAPFFIMAGITVSTGGMLLTSRAGRLELIAELITFLIKITKIIVEIAAEMRDITERQNMNIS